MDFDDDDDDDNENVIREEAQNELSDIEARIAKLRLEQAESKASKNA